MLDEGGRALGCGSPQPEWRRTREADAVLLPPKREGAVASRQTSVWKPVRMAGHSSQPNQCLCYLCST